MIAMNTNPGAWPCVLRVMLRGRFAGLAVASLLISVVPAVPAFAQSTIALARAPGDAARPAGSDRTRTGVARIFDASALWISTASIPPNLIVAPALRSVVDAMLRGSPTFRRQCLRIANAPYMAVMLDFLQPLPGDHARARTVVSTTPDRQRLATIGIGPLGDRVELIAHEIEHVIEQLDNVDLRALAAVPASGVHECHDGDEAFETIRAIRAGLAAAAEVRRHGA